MIGILGDSRRSPEPAQAVPSAPVPTRRRRRRPRDERGHRGQPMVRGTAPVRSGRASDRRREHRTYVKKSALHKLAKFSRARSAPPRGCDAGTPRCAARRGGFRARPRLSRRAGRSPRPRGRPRGRSRTSRPIARSAPREPRSPPRLRLFFNRATHPGGGAGSRDAAASTRPPPRRCASSSTSRAWTCSSSSRTSSRRRSRPSWSPSGKTRRARGRVRGDARRRHRVVFQTRRRATAAAGGGAGGDRAEDESRRGRPVQRQRRRRVLIEGQRAALKPIERERSKRIASGARPRRAATLRAATPTRCGRNAEKGLRGNPKKKKKTRLRRGASAVTPTDPTHTLRTHASGGCRADTRRR